MRGEEVMIFINFQPNKCGEWLKWPLPGLNEDEAKSLANYFAARFKWCSHYTVWEALK